MIVLFILTGAELLDSEGWVVSNDQVGADQRTYTVRRLLPARSYQFRVSAVNDVGEGAGSDPSKVVTLPQQRKYRKHYLILNSSVWNWCVDNLHDHRSSNIGQNIIMKEII